MKPGQRFTWRGMRGIVIWTARDYAWVCVQTADRRTIYLDAPLDELT